MLPRGKVLLPREYPDESFFWKAIVRLREEEKKHCILGEYRTTYGSHIAHHEMKG